MRLTLQVGGAELDMEVAASAGATVADLAEALAGGRLAPGTGLEVDGRFLGPATPVAGAGLRQGDALRLASGPAGGHGGWVGPPAPAVAELHVVGGPCAGACLPLRLGPVVVGRAGDVAIDHPTVSLRHARLQVGQGGHCVVEDLGSTNGTRVDGRFVTSPLQLVPGQLLELGAVQARVVPGRREPTALGPPGAPSGTTPFNRPPRSLPLAGPGPVAVPVAPPEPAPGSRFSWAMLVAPLLVGAVLAVIFDPMMAAFALFSPVITVGMWWEDRRRVQRERDRNVHQQAADLAAFRAELGAALVAEATRRAQVLVDPAETVCRAAGPSTTVWERRRHAPDALRLFLGFADVTWRPPLSEPAGARLPGVDDAVAAHAVLPRSPVAVGLGPGSVLGVVGPRDVVAGLLRSLACQAAVHHGPSDLRLAVLTEAALAPEWDWAKWLPHTEGLRAAGRPDAEALASTWAPADGRPGLLAVVDGDGFTEGRLAPVRDLLASGTVGGVVVASSPARLPSCCTAVLELSGPDGVARLHEPAGDAGVRNLLVAGVPEPAARRCARALARLEDPEEGDGAARLPDEVQLAGLLGLRSLDPGEVERRWRVASAASSLLVVVGVTAEGPLVLDLVADGPHALMAGTTGAGKSELLRTLVSSLAAAYGPDQLAFVLVDYKGGSAFAECARLPHVVGLVTDLDEELGERALRSLEAELRHRERVLAAAGAADLAEYHHRRDRSGDLLPRLVVVVDEFATMKAELGDFVDSLVGIAQRGRSLGVHLVLATQRPSGAVSDNIRANTNLRIALRVQDGPDSTDVLGTPQAATVDRRRPGRGFVRLGPGEVVAFQAALVSTTGPVGGTGADGLVRARPFGFLPEPGTGHGGGPGPTHLAGVVGAATAAARARGGPSPRRVWQEPLPTEVAIHQLPAGALGVADEPDHQRQVPFGWDPAEGNLLLYGVAGSGTTTALASLALSLVRAPGGAARHLYVLDFGHGALAPLAGLPQVGAVVAAGERERQERLLRSLRAELERRRDLVAAGRPEAWPPTVLLVDNLGGFCAAFDDVGGMAVREGLLRLAADGPALGMVLAATADRPGAVPVALSSVVQERLVFRLADPYDYTALGLPAARGGRRPPGRAVHVATRRAVQVGLPAADGLAGLAGAVAASAAAVPGVAPGPAPVAVLPSEVDLSAVTAAADSGGPEWLVPIGIGDTALAPVGLRLGPGDHALVAGPARSGKSTLLCTLAEAVAGAGREVAVWGVAPRRSPLREVASLAGLVVEAAELAGGLAAAMDGPGPVLVLVDDAETLDDPTGAFDALLAARRPDVHVVAAGRADALRSLYGHWTTVVRRSRLGVALRPHLDLDGDLWHTVLPRRGPDRFPPGRGYLVCDGAVELVQVAAPARPAPARP